MNKIVAGIAGALLLSSVAFAKDDVYVGIEYGYSQYDSIISKSSYAPDLGNQTGYTTYQTLVFGKYFDAHRISMKIDGGRKIGFNYDYMFFQEDDFSPYIGTGLYVEQTIYTNADASSSGLYIPLVIGLEQVINDKFSVNIGVEGIIGNYTQSSYYFKASTRKKSVFFALLYKL